MAAVLGLETIQVDFVNAFCQSEQENDVYLELPREYTVMGREDEDLVLYLKKGLYGQKDAGRLFFNHMKTGLQNLSFRQSQVDPCLFIHDEMIFTSFVDDCWAFGKDATRIRKMIEDLREAIYELEEEKTDENLFAYLGINIRFKDGTIELTQEGLIKKFLALVNMEKCESKGTPANLEPLGSDKNGKAFSEKWNYASAVGSLLYLSSNSRPDIQFAVHQCARFTHNPKHSHGVAIKRIARYLKGTSDKGMIMRPDTSKGLDCYVDADFAGLWGHEDDQDPVCVKSRTGYVITLFDCPLYWVSKLQTKVTLSTCASEYVAFSMAMRDLLPLRELLKEIGGALGTEVKEVSEMKSVAFEDNSACLSLINTPKMSTKNKWLAIKYHWFRSHIGNGIVAKKIGTTDQLADGFTKSLPEQQFIYLRKKLQGW